MKRFIYIIFSLLPFVAASQNMYNISDLFDNAPSGTARFVSMGGSMGALGGDLSVMGVNPAGTAIYRSSDVNLSGVYGIVKNRSEYENSAITSKYDGLDLSNIGFVLAYNLDNSPVKFLNFGLNFRRKANYNNNFEMVGASNRFSQQYVIDYMYWQNPFDFMDMSKEMYRDFNYNWLALLAAHARMYDADGNFLLAPDDDFPDMYNLIYEPTTLGYYSETRGGLNVFDMNISANINDRFYLGATLGYYRLDYSRYSCYYEATDTDRKYVLENDYRLRGSGWDFKLGAILRPFKYSPFKIAAFLHSPVLYKLTDSYSASIDGPRPNDDYFATESEECYGDKVYVSYSLRTPWKFGAAMSYTFGNFLAVNAEYEYSDAASTSFTEGNDIDLAQNEEVSYNLKAQHTVRLGAEFSLNKLMKGAGFDKVSSSVRVGYNFISSPFKNDAYKCMDNAVLVDTSTEFMNKYSKNVFTAGFGVVVKSFYFDLAYMYQTQKSDFYPFYDMDFVNPAAKVKTTGHTIMAGVGIRF